jgi:hypothetical protein
MTLDLFDIYEMQPDNLKKICEEYEMEYNDPDICRQFLAEVEEIGYSFDYGLDAVPFNLRKK